MAYLVNFVAEDMDLVREAIYTSIDRNGNNILDCDFSKCEIVRDARGHDANSTLVRCDTEDVAKWFKKGFSVDYEKE